MIRFRFLAERDLGAYAIRAFTRAPVNHVELVMPNGEYLGARDNGGVLIRPKNYTNPLKEYFAIVQTTAEETINAIAFATAQVGKPYDWKAIFGIVFDEKWHERKAWICSALVMAICMAANKFPVKVPFRLPFWITPGQLFDSPLMIPDGEYNP